MSHSPQRVVMVVTAFTALLFALLMTGCASSDSSGGIPGTTSGGGAGVFGGGDQPPSSTGTIAYTRGDELRLVEPDGIVDTCQAEWGPTTATGTQLIAIDGGEYADTSVIKILEIIEGATRKPAPVFSLDPTIQVVDLHWLPDGSGFLFARRNSQLEYDVNIWQYKFATGVATQLTNVQFANGIMQRFSMSPDGSRIAFEMVDRLYGNDPFLGFSDLWIMNRDGSGQRLLANDGAYPAWNPLR